MNSTIIISRLFSWMTKWRDDEVDGIPGHHPPLNGNDNNNWCPGEEIFIFPLLAMLRWCRTVQCSRMFYRRASGQLKMESGKEKLPPCRDSCTLTELKKTNATPTSVSVISAINHFVGRCNWIKGAFWTNFNFSPATALHELQAAIECNSEQTYLYSRRFDAG